MKETRFWVPAVFFAAILFFLPSALYGETKKPPVGAVVAWQGVVYVQHEGDAKRKEVSRNEAVFANYTITTGMASKAKLLMKDDSVISLGENSSIKIKDYSVDARKGIRTVSLKMISGAFRSIVNSVFGSKQSAFRVETNTAVVGVKGTDFIVVSRSSDETSVYGLSGEVTVGSASTAIGGEVLLRPHYGSKVRLGFAPGEPYELPDDIIMKLIDETTLNVTYIFEVSDSGCSSCHAVIVSEMGAARFKHPHSESNCATCHIKAYLKEKTIRADVYSRDSIMPLELSNGVKYKVIVKAKDKGGAEAVYELPEFQMPYAEETVIGDSAPPSVSDLKVDEISGGVFYSAAISWTSSEPTRSYVEYGTAKSYDKVVKAESYYTTEHKVTLASLTDGERYYVRVVSEDVSGNKSQSEPIDFRIRGPYAPQRQSARSGAPIINSAKIIKAGMKTYVEWKSDREMAGEVTVSEGEAGKEFTLVDPHYPGRRTRNSTGMYACSICHKGKIHTKDNHSVGGVSWYNRKKPKDLTLGEGDVLLCSTCHSPHGSSYPYLLRKSETALCTTCHKEND